MLKTVLAATAAVTIAGSSLVYAQPADGRRDGGRRMPPSVEDIQAFQAARLAGLRAGLMLTAEQEKHWPAFESAMRELQQLRLSRMAKRREARRDGGRAAIDPTERMRQRAVRLSESGAVLKRLADAMDPLYRSLDESQKRRFAMLARIAGPRGSGWHRRGGGGERGFRRGRDDSESERGRDGREPGFRRGPRRGGADRTELLPDLIFGNKAVYETPIGQASVGHIPGDKFSIERGVAFAARTIAGETTQFRGKLNLAHQVPIFSRKVIIDEPAAFGPKNPKGLRSI